METKQLLNIVLGPWPGLRRALTLCLAANAGFASLDCQYDCTMRGWLVQTVGGTLILACLGALIWLQQGGWAMLRALMTMRRIRRTADPVAAALGATMEQAWEQESWVLRYRFRDGHFVVVLATANGVTSWSPDWKPGEKDTKGADVLEAVIKGVTPGAAS